MNILLILIGKLISQLFRLLNLGNGSTWPGHIALKANKHFISDLLKNSSMQIIIVAGTNGKTTTASMIKHLLEADGKNVLLNQSGANLLNGIASTLLLHTDSLGKLPFDFAVFEVDENALPRILTEVTPQYLVLLNLFRDQLDRYGEVHTIADKWEAAINQLPQTTTLVLNADDPEIAWVGLQGKTKSTFFGLQDKALHKQTQDHAVDSVYCPQCNSRLAYKTNYYSHLGDWHCPECQLNHPDIEALPSVHYPLSGTYNRYNTHAAVLVAKLTNISTETIDSALKKFTPAFGRQEILKVKNKTVQLFLSKNPISFNQSLETISSLKGKNLLIVLNDRVADGHDVSWIWDTNIEQSLSQVKHVTISGDRCYDMALRVKYADKEFTVKENLEEAIEQALEKTETDETLYILPTYTAMLEVRKILTGKKIL